MRQLPSFTRLAMALAAACAIAMPARALVPITTTGVAAEETTPRVEHPQVTVPAFAPLFASADDARAFWKMWGSAYSAPVPDPRLLAKAFIREYLGVDGDDYVVAHFASAKARSEGRPDQVVTLTYALMEAFPEHSRHTFFAGLSDAVGSLNTGGQASPTLLTLLDQIVHGRSATAYVSSVGQFLWSRTGPGYIYNTFVAKGNIVDTVYEDLRRLDDAFGVFRISAGFSKPPSFRLSRVVDMFKATSRFSELPYVKKLHTDLDAYWKRVGPDWPVLARYRFVEAAREAHATGVLTQRQFEQVMAGGAPNIPLQGAITLAQLRETPPRSVQVRRFDINGYASSNMLRFMASDGSEVIYMPGASPAFVTVASEAELRHWVLTQAKQPKTLDALLSRFSLYNQQDGVFWSGVNTSLQRMAEGRWSADDRLIDTRNAAIAGDVFEDMRQQTEARLRDDARMKVSTAWEAWRTTLSRTVTLLGPLGYAPPLAIPVQAGNALAGLGLGLDHEIEGRTYAERKAGLEQGVLTFVTAIPMGAAFGSLDNEWLTGPSYGVDDGNAGQGAEAFALAPLQRVNGRVGYPLSPLGSPRLPAADAVVPDIDAMPPSDAGDAPSASGVAPMEQLAPEEGYLAQVVPDNDFARAVEINLRQKKTIDSLSEGMEQVRGGASWTNANGYMVRNDRALAFRLDVRTPEQLIANGGFGPSGNDDPFRTFSGVVSMLSEPSTRGNGSLSAVDRVYMHWQHNRFGAVAPDRTVNQYAIWTYGREVASLAENAGPGGYDQGYEELHFPHDIPARDIFIVDSDDAMTSTAIAELVASDYVYTPYGVPLEALVEYRAGSLDIHAPNRFTDRHPIQPLAVPPQAGVYEVQPLP